MPIVNVTNNNKEAWGKLCNELWPHKSVQVMLKAFSAGEYKNEYLYQLDGAAVAFVSLSVCHDYVEGKSDSRPVGYLEAIYTKSDYRSRDIAKELVLFAKAWASERGCSMLASDCELTNNDSRRFHNKIGFA